MRPAAGTPNVIGVVIEPASRLPSSPPSSVPVNSYLGGSDIGAGLGARPRRRGERDRGPVDLTVDEPDAARRPGRERPAASVQQRLDDRPGLVDGTRRVDGQPARRDDRVPDRHRLALAAGEPRPALLRERAEPLAPVVGPEDGLVQLVLGGEALGERPVGAADRRLRLADADRRALGDRSRQRDGLVARRAAVDDPRYDPPGLRLRRRQPPAGEDDVPRPRRTRPAT